MAAECIPKCLDLGDQDTKLNNIAIESHKNADMSVANSDHANEANAIHPVKINEVIGDVLEEVKLKRSLRPRSGTYYGVFDISSGEESECEQLVKDQSSKCPRRKVNTSRSSNKSKHEEEEPRWIPEEGRRPVIEEAPVFFPTEEEFKDTLTYISKIRKEAEHIGICRIIPPSSWSPPCPLKERAFYEHVMFTTRIQQVDKLQNREPTRRRSRNRCQRKRKRRKRLRFGMTRRRNSTAVTESSDCVSSDTDEKFGFQSGSDFTLDMFEKYADKFKRQYFGMKDADGNYGLNDMEHDQRCQPSVEDIEGEYWRIVEDTSDEIEVHYGADLDTGVFASGFPKSSTKNITEIDPYVQSGWNLNNLPRLPGSVLSFEKEDISGVLVPWLYIGMCFSSFCWHVEDHHLYSLNYMHFGDAKVWYGVPGSAAVKLEEAMRKHLPDLFEEQPDLLHELVTQLSPSILKAEGVPVYRAIQRPGEFVMTFPRAYHSGFNCGFNCAEAVNVAPVDWLPHGQCAVELYSEQHRKTSISHDKLLFDTAKEAVKELCKNSHLCEASPRLVRWQTFCGKNGTLTEAIKARVIMEHKRRESVSSILDVRNMKKDFDLTEKECFACYYDLHLSAIGCECSPNRYACVSHASTLCMCESTRKFVLARYDLDKLDTLVAALEGNLDAMTLCGLEEDVCELPKNSSVSEQANDGLTETHRPLIDINVTNVCAYDHDNTKEVCKDHPQLGEDKRCILFEEHEQICDMNEPCASGCSDDEYILTNGQLECSKSGGIANCTNSRDPATRDIESEVDIHENKVKYEVPSSGKTNLLLNSNKCKSRLFCSDLNSAFTVLEPKVETEKYGDHGESAKAAMTSIDGQGIWIHGVSKQCQLNSTTDAGGHIRGRTQIEHEAMRKADKLTETNFDGGPSGSQYLCTDLVFSQGCPDRNVDVGSFSNDSGSPRKASPKLFGVELQHPCSSSMASDIQSSFPTLVNSIHSIKFDQHVPRTPKHFVEPLNFGKVMQGRLWCNKQAIFPNGFRSRVNFLSVLDPMKTCYYISEVLDAGLMGPFFKVTVEDKPDVSFTNGSALECWEMVRQKLNQEIVRLSYIGNQDLPPLLTPELMDGLDMFGFRSPSIVHVIESMDPYHLCLEYWSSKSNQSLTTVHVKVEPPRFIGTPGSVMDTDNCRKKRKLFGVDLAKNEEASNETEGVESVVRGLFQKASLEELRMMQKILCNDSGSSYWQTAYDTVLDEIQKNVYRKE